MILNMSKSTIINDSVLLVACKGKANRDLFYFFQSMDIPVQNCSVF